MRRDWNVRWRLRNNHRAEAVGWCALFLAWPLLAADEGKGGGHGAVPKTVIAIQGDEFYPAGRAIITVMRKRPFQGWKAWKGWKGKCRFFGLDHTAHRLKVPSNS